MNSVGYSRQLTPAEIKDWEDKFYKPEKEYDMELVDVINVNMEYLIDIFGMGRWKYNDEIDVMMKKFLGDMVELRKMIVDENDEMINLLFDLRKIYGLKNSTCGNIINIGTPNGNEYCYRYYPEKRMFMENGKYVSREEIVKFIDKISVKRISIAK